MPQVNLQYKKEEIVQRENHKVLSEFASIILYQNIVIVYYIASVSKFRDKNDIAPINHTTDKFHDVTHHLSSIKFVKYFNMSHPS